MNIYAVKHPKNILKNKWIFMLSNIQIPEGILFLEGEAMCCWGKLKDWFKGLYGNAKGYRYKIANVIVKKEMESGHLH